MSTVEHVCTKPECGTIVENNSGEPATCPKCGSHLTTYYDGLIAPDGSYFNPDMAEEPPDDLEEFNKNEAKDYEHEDDDEDEDEDEDEDSGEIDYEEEEDEEENKVNDEE